MDQADEGAGAAVEKVTRLWGKLQDLESHISDADYALTVSRDEGYAAAWLALAKADVDECIDLLADAKVTAPTTAQPPTAT